MFLIACALGTQVIPMATRVRKFAFGIAAILAAAVSFVLVPSAHATPVPVFQTTYTLNVDFCSTPCLNGSNGGTITLAQDGADAVMVTVSLSGVDFHNTTSFDAFAFNISGQPAISVSGLPSGWALDPASESPFHEDGAQDFMYGIDASGNKFTGISSITFTVTDTTGLTTDDFHVLSVTNGTHPQPGPVYFEAAVYNGNNTSCTGVIGANGGTTPTYLGGGTGTCSSSTNVPEPNSLAILGAGLIGLGLVRVLYRRNGSYRKN